MKIQLDTTAKTIKIEQSVKISTLIETLKRLLPNNEWKQFTLETNTVIQQWSSPIIIRETYPALPTLPARPYYQPWQPWYVASQTNAGLNVGHSLKASAGNNLSLKAGVFNVEV